MAAPTSNTTPTSMPATLASIAPWTHALLRIGAGLLYMEHGLQKLFGMFGGMDGAGATVTLVSQFGLAGVLETFGGLLLVLPLLYMLVFLFLVGHGAGRASLDARSDRP